MANGPCVSAAPPEEHWRGAIDEPPIDESLPGVYRRETCGLQVAWYIFLALLCGTLIGVGVLLGWFFKG